MINAEVVLNFLDCTSEVRPPDIENQFRTTTGAQQISCTLEPLLRGEACKPGRPTQYRKPGLRLVDLQGCSSCRVFRRRSETVLQRRKTTAPAVRMIHPN